MTQKSFYLGDESDFKSHELWLQKDFTKQCRNYKNKRLKTQEVIWKQSKVYFDDLEKVLFATKRVICVFTYKIKIEFELSSSWKSA